MQTVGQKFAAEREKRGISIRDAAEATKIRADFLSALENDAYDFDLPEIYKRGFIKNYARFLKLDTEVILNDYTAQRTSSSRGALKRGSGGNDLIGIINLNQSDDRKRSGAPAAETSRQGREPSRRAPEVVNDLEDFDADEPAKSSPFSADRLMVFKLLTIFVALVLVIILSVVLVRAITQGPTGDSPEPTAGEAVNREAPRVLEPLVLSALGPVFVIVDEPGRGIESFRGTLDAGAEQVLNVGTPVRIRLTVGVNLEIEFRGERFVPTETGIGIVTLPRP